MVSVSELQLTQFHKIDRYMFSCLVAILNRDIGESLLVMSLWMWLEEIGFPSIIKKLAGFSSYALINQFANEAVTCLKCLEDMSATVPVNGGLPLTKTLTAWDMSLQIFRKRRFTAISGVKSFLKNLCARIFTDIIYRILGPTFKPEVPGFPHPLYGSLELVPLPTFIHNFDADFKFWEWDASGDNSDDDRILFLTFSKGFPVSESEVRWLFTTKFGLGCVKNVFMGTGSDSSEQSLYATLVVNSVLVMDRVLDGNPVAKFRVNGKFVWARKYERRD